jgi:hypothetical protein
LAQEAQARPIQLLTPTQTVQILYLVQLLQQVEALVEQLVQLLDKMVALVAVARLVLLVEQE